MPIIVTCGCGDTDNYAVAAFKILFRNQPTPEVVSQTYKNVEFEKWAPYIEAAEKAKEKYAYYLTETQMWDLLKGERIA